jgi:cobalt/nickel transport system ATP-binding protein
MSVLHIDNVSFSYPDGTQVLEGLNLSVAAGESVAILGPNGAGKTTLLLQLIRILHPDAGTITVDGIELTEDSARDVRRRIGMVFQDPDDQLFMPSVREDVAFGPANFGRRGEELEAIVDRALAQVGMAGSKHRAPHHLSGGERRRVALATVLAMDPSVLILDEPSSNLDPAGRRELATVLAGLDTTLIMVTHDLPYALELCERTVIIDAGTVVADGGTAEILSDAGLLGAHRLELPYGFDPRNVTQPGTDHTRPGPAR